MTYQCEGINVSDWDENDRSWFIVYFSDLSGNDFSVEGYNTSCGQVIIADCPKGLPWELEEIVVNHFDPYYNKSELTDNCTITINKGA